MNEMFRFQVGRTASSGERLSPEEWEKAFFSTLSDYRIEGTDHKPETHFALLYGKDGLFGKFQVKDRYVRSVSVRWGEGVCGDSCVEFFSKPDAGEGYINTEFNAGGNKLASHVIDPSRTGHGPLAKVELLTEDEAKSIRCFSSLPSVIEPEIASPVDWSLEFYIPFALYEKLFSCSKPRPGTVWHGNFYKCGDKTSHPHWGSWTTTRACNFHDPEIFGRLEFI